MTAAQRAMRRRRKSPPAQAPTSPVGALLRVFWLMVGNIVVYVTWIAIVFTTAPLPSLLDVVVWLTVLAMIVARRIDIVRYAGRTMDGEPATLADWRRYVALSTGVMVVGELLAHQLGGSLLR